MKLKAPENAGATVSYEGIEYEVKDGVVEVPDTATDLIHHGYTPASDDTPAKPAKARRSKSGATAEE